MSTITDYATINIIVDSTMFPCMQPLIHVPLTAGAHVRQCC
jgi:hypothetical protein